MKIKSAHLLFEFEFPEVENPLIEGDHRVVKIVIVMGYDAIAASRGVLNLGAARSCPRLIF